MPKCKYCGARLSKFDKDMCPVCGSKDPLEGVSSETVEITSQVFLDKSDVEYKPHKKSIAFLLFALVGWSGAPLFYIKRTTFGLVYLFVSLLLVGGIGCLLSFLTPLGMFGFLVVGVLDYIFNIGFGALLIFRSEYKDGDGEFLK